MSTGGNLSAKRVVHLNVTGFSGNRQWKEGIKKCLQEAEREQLTSIAFPALGTGNYLADYNIRF